MIPLALAALAILSPGASAAEGKPPRVGIRGSELRHLDSTILGERLEIDIALPRGYENETASYPVVYVLDAETNFGATSYIARRLMKNGDIPNVLVVGIAYDTSYDDFYVKRGRDLTPVPTQRFPGSGGAARFARFLEEELFPFVATHYRVEPGDRTLYGHSFGGLFAHYVLFEHPQLFQRILSVSPSIWYGDRHLVSREEARFQSGRAPEAVLYTAVGSDESEYFVDDWKELTHRLTSRRYPGLFMKSEILANENHRSVFGSAFTNGLRYVFSLWVLNQVLRRDSPEQGYWVLGPQTSLDAPREPARLQEWKDGILGELVQEGQERGPMARLLDRLIEVNRDPVAHTLTSDPSRGYLVDRTGSFQEYFQPVDIFSTDDAGGNHGGGWKRLREENPHVLGLIEASVPAYDPRSGLALVYIGRTLGERRGSGLLLLYRVGEGGLEELTTATLWVA